MIFFYGALRARHKNNQFQYSNNTLWRLLWTSPQLNTPRNSFHKLFKKLITFWMHKLWSTMFLKSITNFVPQLLKFKKTWSFRHFKSFQSSSILTHKITIQQHSLHLKWHNKCWNHQWPCRSMFTWNPSTKAVKAVD